MIFDKAPFVNRMKGTCPRWLNPPPPTPTGCPRWEEQMTEVKETATTAMIGEYPAEFFEANGLPCHIPEPLVEHVADMAGEPSGKRAAMLVQMDWPIDLLKFLLIWLRGEGHTYQHEDGRWAQQGSFDFIGSHVYVFLFTLWHMTKAILVIFRLKWLEMVPRPEEWFGGNMTLYPEGCPGHPAWPAGHGGFAGSICRCLLALFGDMMTEAQIVTLVETCLLFASYRTLAGVHRHEENIVGFVVGWASFKRISFDQAVSEIEAYVPGSIRIALAA